MGVPFPRLLRKRSELREFFFQFVLWYQSLTGQVLMAGMAPEQPGCAALCLAGTRVTVAEERKEKGTEGIWETRGKNRKSEKLQHPSLSCLPFGLQPVCAVAYKNTENQFLSSSCCHFVFSLMAYSSWAKFPLLSADSRMPPCSYMLIYGLKCGYIWERMLVLPLAQMM